MFAARKAGARNASTRDSVALTLVPPPDEPARPREDEQVAHDFRGAIGFAINALHIASQRLRKGARGAQQLEMAEHALQRVVQLVRDAGDKLAERRELFGLHQPVPQIGALGFELRVRRDVARRRARRPIDSPSSPSERCERDEKRSAQHRIVDFCRKTAADRFDRWTRFR